MLVRTLSTAFLQVDAKLWLVLLRLRLTTRQWHGLTVLWLKWLIEVMFEGLSKLCKKRNFNVLETIQSVIGLMQIN